MSIEHTIIFTGPAEAGKSTAVASVSDIPVVRTQEVLPRMMLDLGSRGKKKPESMSIAMDYGQINLSGGDQIHLFTTSGEERFDFMWDALVERAIGVLILIDNSRPSAPKDMEFFLSTFSPLVTQGQAVIGVTHMDEHPVPTLNTYHERAELLGVRLPIFELDARRKEDIQTALRALLYSQDPGLVQAPI